MAYEYRTKHEIHNDILKVLEDHMKRFKDKEFLLTTITYEEEVNRVISDGLVVDYLPTGKVFISLEAERYESI